MIKKYTPEKRCYLISWNIDIDGKFLDKEEVLNKILEEGMALIVIFKNLVIIKEEQGFSMKYILYTIHMQSYNFS